MNSVQRVIASFKMAGDQLEKGRKVEQEHTDVYVLLETFLEKNGLKMPLSRKEFFEMIAKSHIKEVRDYYDKLEKYVEPKGH